MRTTSADIGDVTNFYCRSHRNVQVRWPYLVIYRLESFDVDRDCEVV